MWIFLGLGALVFAILNVVSSFKNKEAKWYRFISLSLTALSVCSTYYAEARRVAEEDWSGLMDIMPSMSKALWVCVILSILINAISLFRENKNRNMN